MAVGTNLNALAARPQFPYGFQPIKVTVEAHSADYVHQAATVASSIPPKWTLRYGPTSVADRDEFYQHWLDNKGLTFPWTFPGPGTFNGVTLQVRYEPENEGIEFQTNGVGDCHWEVTLIPAVT